MPRTVLLLHTLADGSFHYDWLLERAGAGGLITFRLGFPLHEEPRPSFSAERLPDHRDLYLAYQGPLTGGRGEVRRVAAGACEVVEEGEGVLRARMELGAARGMVSGRRIGGGAWELALRPHALAGP